MICEDLKGKKVLVTGSSSGIGVATAVMFAQQGCFVGVHYFQTKDGAEKTLEEVKKFSDGCLLCADMRDAEQVGQMIAEFADTAGGIDVLVNNAGTLVGRMSFAEATVDFYEDVFATNTTSVFLATRAAAKPSPPGRPLVETAQPKTSQRRYCSLQATRRASSQENT
ncbi:MAG: hypothetical protein DRP66_03965 [Planctomycetota bacterium]|nr:MAG: hypothetical protein DRP66_03965 [Planctomycetota bacterium]